MCYVGYVIEFWVVVQFETKLSFKELLGKIFKTLGTARIRNQCFFECGEAISGVEALGCPEEQYCT
jgi:hypothetical protein